MICLLWDLWWNTKLITESLPLQTDFKMGSSMFFLSLQCCHNDRSLVQSESSGGGFICRPNTHLLQLNLNNDNVDDVKKPCDKVEK